MNNNPDSASLVDLGSYHEFRAQLPIEELQKLQGKEFACCCDNGAWQIVESASTLDDLYRLLNDAGIDSRDVVFDRVPGEENVFGGVQLL